MSKDFFVNTCENARLRRSPNEQMGRAHRLADAEVGKVPADSLQRTSPETPANPRPLWARLGQTPPWKPRDPVLWEPRRTKIVWFLKMRLLPLLLPVLLSPLSTGCFISDGGWGVTSLWNRAGLTQTGMQWAGIQMNQKNWITPKPICPPRPWDVLQL